jgi:hypothetical protein
MRKKHGGWMYGSPRLYRGGELLIHHILGRAQSSERPLPLVTALSMRAEIPGPASRRGQTDPPDKRGEMPEPRNSIPATHPIEPPNFRPQGVWRFCFGAAPPSHHGLPSHVTASATTAPLVTLQLPNEACPSQAGEPHSGNPNRSGCPLPKFHHVGGVLPCNCEHALPRNMPPMNLTMAGGLDGGSSIQRENPQVE